MQARPPQAVRSIYLEACGQDRVVTQYSEPPEKKGQALMAVQTKNYNYKMMRMVKFIRIFFFLLHLSFLCPDKPHLKKQNNIHRLWKRTNYLPFQRQQGDFSGVN